MLIRCKHERPGGSLVTFSHKDLPDYRAYDFQPNAKGAHVADVEDEGDAATLLAIDSAYVPYDEAATKFKAKASEVKPDAEEVDPTSFLDELDLKGLHAHAKKEGVKLDENHSVEQVRNYLKGLLKAKAE
jgi:hypothetical protein